MHNFSVKQKFKITIYLLREAMIVVEERRCFLKCNTIYRVCKKKNTQAYYYAFQFMYGSLIQLNVDHELTYKRKMYINVIESCVIKPFTSILLQWVVTIRQKLLMAGSDNFYHLAMGRSVVRSIKRGQSQQLIYALKHTTRSLLSMHMR